MTFPGYPKYKESGVEWLGEMPEYWGVIAIKWLSPSTFWYGSFRF